jgi:hypothetical protein
MAMPFFDYIQRERTTKRRGDKDSIEYWITNNQQSIADTPSNISSKNL